MLHFQVQICEVELAGWQWSLNKHVGNKILRLVQLLIFPAGLLCSKNNKKDSTRTNNKTVSAFKSWLAKHKKLPQCDHQTLIINYLRNVVNTKWRRNLQWHTSSISVCLWSQTWAMTRLTRNGVGHKPSELCGTDTDYCYRVNIC